METIQNDIFRAMDVYMGMNGLSKDKMSKTTGISPADVRRVLDGEFEGTLEELVVLMLKLNKVPVVSFRSLEDVIMEAQSKEVLDDDVWVTKDGRKLRVSDMKDDHLTNTIRYIERSAALEAEQRMILDDTFSTYEPQYPDIYEVMVEEAHKRGLSID